MVQTLINLDKREDMVVNVVKGKFGLSNKNDAIKLIISEYEKESLEPELRPEYAEKLKGIMGQKGKRFSTVEELDEYLSDA
jgi:hypothetical protein